MAKPCISLPGSAAYVLRGVSVPASVLEGVDLHILEKSVDDLCLTDIEVQEGSIASISAALCEGQSAKGSRAVETVKHRGGMALPTFADLHTHIGKPQWSGVVLWAESVLPGNLVHLLQIGHLPSAVTHQSAVILVISVHYCSRLLVVLERTCQFGHRWMLVEGLQVNLSVLIASFQDSPLSTSSPQDYVTPSMSCACTCAWPLRDAYTVFWAAQIRGTHARGAVTLMAV